MKNIVFEQDSKKNLKETISAIENSLYSYEGGFSMRYDPDSRCYIFVVMEPGVE